MNSVWVEETLSRMSLEEKVGQVLLVGFYNFNQETEEAILQKILAYHLGGFFHFSLPYHHVAEFVEKVQSRARIPLLVASDYEAGPGVYAEGGILFPRPMARGWSGNEASEYEIGKAIAAQARAIGVNFTFSPVVDVNTHSQCPDVNIRAYGDDPDKIIELARGYIRGLQENGVLAAAKHFPGNGCTPTDQHITPAIVDYPREILESVYLKPYRALIPQTNVAAIMVAHLEVPALVSERHPVSGRPVPASLSQEIITNLLKGEMGYQGMVMTDALNMGAINNLYTREEAVIKCLQAGNDILLNFSPRDFERDYESILRAVRSGAIPEERLEDAVRKILEAKERLGLPQTKGMPADRQSRERIFLDRSCNALAANIAENAVTLLRNQLGILPLPDVRGRKVSVFNIFEPENKVLRAQGQFPKTEIIAQRLAERGARVTVHEVSSDWHDGELNAHFSEALDSDVVFVNFFVTPSYAIGTLVPNRNALRLFFHGLLTETKQVVITSFGDPYVIVHFQHAPTYLCTFDETPCSQEAAMRVWFGEAEPKGRMPVSLKGIFERGDGEGF